MHKSKIIIIVFLIASHFNSFSQDDRVRWSEKYDEDGHYTLLTETADGVIVLRKDNTDYPDFDRGAYLELVKFDLDLKVSYSVELKDLEKSSYENVRTITSPEGIAHIYYQRTKSGEIIVSAQLFNLEDLRKTEIVDLARFKVKSRKDQRATELNDLDIIYPIDVVLSQDKSKLGIYFNQEQVGKRRESYYQYVVIDVDNQFNALHNGDFYSDNRSDKYKISDLDLSNNGELTYMIKRYKEDVKTEFINKKPAYTYELHHMAGDTTDYIYDISTKGDFIDRLMVSSDDDGNVFVAGYIRKKPQGEITSAFFLGLDPLGYDLAKSRDKYRPREIEEMQGKKDTELDDDFKIVDLIAADDIVYCIKQYRRYISTRGNNNMGYRNTGFGTGGFRNNNFGDIDYNWDFEEVVIEGFSKNTGEMLWSVTNPRRQEENQQYVRGFIRGHHQVEGNDLYLFYNERPENVERLRKREDLKSTNMPGDQSEPMMVRVNSEGDIKYRSIKGEKRYHVPNTGVLIGEVNLYFIHSKSNFDKFMIGKAGREILQF